MEQEKKFVTNKNNSVIAGVCGGIGKYFNFDPNLIRVAFVLFSLSGGSGLLIYLILWMIMSSNE